MEDIFMPDNKKDWYDENIFMNIFWLISGIAWLPISGIAKIAYGDNELPKWIRWWGNRVDNLPDAIKEWIHCHDIPFTDKQINISRWMKNRETYGKIIRPRRDPAGNCWSNCDPEDCK
jgi:hypothetical protein